MKKLFVFFLGLSLLTACSSDDDVASQEDPIVGTWVLVDASFVTPETCEEESTITFTSDKDANGTFYLEEANCEGESSTGNWENNGNNSYTVSIPVVGALPGTASFSSEDRFVFLTDNFGSFTFERQ